MGKCALNGKPIINVVRKSSEISNELKKNYGVGLTARKDPERFMKEIYTAP